MPMVPIRRFFSELDKTLDEADASFEERVGEHMAYRAALFLLRGDEDDITERDVDSDKLMFYAHQLKKMGGMNIKEYAKRCYGGVDPEKVDLKELKFDYYLYHVVDLLDLQEPDDRYDLLAAKEDLGSRLQDQEEDNKLIFADYWLSRNDDRQAAKNAGECKEEDKSVYEYEAPYQVWKNYAAGMHFRYNRGAVPASRKNVEKLKRSPFDVLTLRNKRTVEHLKRGEMDSVAAARQKTEKSFTFLREKELAAAQQEAQQLSRQMHSCTGDAAGTREWGALKSAVFKFQTAETQVDAARASAEVLLAVEKFTKGKKNASQSPEVKACVDLALKSLEVAIPDAARNPSVRPLVDRFNDVRRYRLQFGSMVTLAEGKSVSAAASKSEVWAYESKKLDKYVENVLLGPDAQPGEYEGVEILPILNEEQAAEHVALAVALGEADTGFLDVTSEDWEAKVQALKADPAVLRLARDLSRDADVRREARENSGRFSSYMRKKYTKLQWELKQDAARDKEADFSAQNLKNRQQIENDRKEMLEKQREIKEAAEGREQDFRIDLEWREKDLGKKLEEMGSGDYKFRRYDPEKARALFAEVLAVKEMRDRQAKGEKPGPIDLQTRKRELEKDGAVARMAATLPGDGPFRALLGKRPEKNGPRFPALSAALEESYRSFAKGRQMSECYLQQRETARQLADAAGEKAFTPQQAARLAANLVAVRELEVAAGGKDVPVDEKRLEQRIRELEQEPDIKKTGWDLLSPKYQAFLKKMTANKQDPERFIAGTIFSAFQKLHPDKVLQPKPEEPSQPGESLQAEGGVPVL